MKIELKKISKVAIISSLIMSMWLYFGYDVSVINAQRVSKDISSLSDKIASKIVSGFIRVDSDRDGLSDVEEDVYGTHPYMKDTDRDGYSDTMEIKFGYDPTGAGRPDLSIHIPKINISAPITYPVSRAESDIQDAMDNGVAYYPGTGFPGQEGNAYLTGHSSNYFWSRGKYNKIFRELRQLEIGDTFSIVQTQSTGKKINYNYRIYEKRITENSDKSLFFADREGSVVTLVTSWPIGATKQRLMVRGILIK